MPKRLFIRTYGCQMNEYDSARMADMLVPLGYARWPAPEGADLVILNTCHIREKAAEKVYSELGRLRLLQDDRKRQGGRMVLAVAGCVAQAEGAELHRRAPHVDLILGPQTYHRLPAMLARLGGAAPVIETEFPAESKFDFLPEQGQPQGPAAYLTIQEGCDKFCTFCVVPYTRGAELSRPAAAVLQEAVRLCDQGAREITLLGQNVNAYRGADGAGALGLGGLIHWLAGIRGLARIRYTTSHPRDMGPDLIAAHRDVPALMPYLHLPAQSGSDRVLKTMNRGHTAADYLRVVERLRRARPDLAFGSDFIVGYPGETDAEFAETLSLVREVGYAQAYAFKYSPRPGTPAAEAAQVGDRVKEDRLAELQSLLTAQQQAYNAASVGRVIVFVFDRPGRQPGQVVGRTPHNQAVHAAGGTIGAIAPVRLDRAGTQSFAGTIASATRVAEACA